MDTFRFMDMEVHKKKNSKDKQWIITLVLLILALITRVLTYLAAKNPHLVETLYSSTIYPHIAKVLSFINSVFPFSLGEISLILLSLFLVTAIIFLFLNPKVFIKNILNIFHLLLRSIAILYILFYFLWGFNYYREDYMDLANMNKDIASFQELKSLTKEIIYKTNNIRENLPEDNFQLFYIEENFQELSKLAQNGFENFTIGTVNLDVKHGQAKPVLLSKYMSFTGIMGIYYPFTAEPNVNTDVPYHNLLSTITHEIAHQKGFAKEDEANFIAYRANINNSDQRFQYSGYYLAMQHLLNAVYQTDREDYFILYEELSDAVIRDMDYSRDFWKSKEGKAEEVMTSVNDNYLKANNQQDGVKSYDLVVKLLLSEYKGQKIHK